LALAPKREMARREIDDQHVYATEPDPEDGWLSRQRALVLVLLAATTVAVYLCYRLALPFLPALAWALALAVVAHPLPQLARTTPPPSKSSGGFSRRARGCGDHRPCTIPHPTAHP
jgi:hypothetical protein